VFSMLPLRKLCKMIYLPLAIILSALVYFAQLPTVCVPVAERDGQPVLTCLEKVS
jgi:hypothetical protein